MQVSCAPRGLTVRSWVHWAYTPIPPPYVRNISTVSKFAFKARIIDDPSPHYYLPNPCELAIADKPQKQLNRTFLHTTFISSDDYTESSSNLPNVGDLVKVRLTKNIFSYKILFLIENRYI